MNPREPLAAEDFDYVRQLLKVASALTLDPGKEYLVQSRLDPLARQEGFSCLAAMLKSLRTGPSRELHRKVVEAMTNNETLFFRDPRVFQMIASSLLPAISAQRTAERSFNIWCAACSSGQEPYSVAMVLRENMPDLEGWNVRIIASDISREILARAMVGRYSQVEVNRGLPARHLVKYFRQHGSAWEVTTDIRRMVEFREINLIQPWPRLPLMHLVLMRNVLIYMEIPTKKMILESVRNILDPRGFLILGAAESTANLDDGFEPFSCEGIVSFRRRRDKSVRTPLRRVLRHT